MRVHLLLIPTMILFLASVLVGCATAPAKFEFDPVETVSGDYDRVWAALVEYFAIANVPIDTIVVAARQE